MKVLIFAPYFKNLEFIGNKRLVKIIDWLTSSNHSVCVIGSGFNDYKISDGRFEEIFLCSPFNLNPGIDLQGNIQENKRKKSKIRRYLANKISLIDPYIYWGFYNIIRGEFSRIITDFKPNIILTSSPPESVHFVAYVMSLVYNIPTVTDMRDGWLDEPLKEYLNKASFRTFIERQIEKIILRHTKLIILTSVNWRNELLSRFPEFKTKTLIVTNTYPNKIIIDENIENEIEISQRDEIIISYVGNISNSRLTQTSEKIFEVLNYSIPISNKKHIRINFYGSFTISEEKCFDKWSGTFITRNISIKNHGKIASSMVYNIYNKSDYLLLLSDTKNAIPMKIFEYIQTKKPIIAITRIENALYEIIKDVPQVIFLNIDKLESNDLFMLNENIYSYRATVPIKYSQEYNANIYINAIDECIA